MNASRRITEGSKTLSWLLRHGAIERQLAMDVAGFADIDDVLRLTGLDRDALDMIVSENNKSRFQIVGERIRAVQGHSEGTPVTREGLEASWDVVIEDDAVFHGTTVAAARSILTGDGIHSATRSHVHLAPSTTSVVGKRHEVQVLLVIDPPRLRAVGHTLWRAPNGVLLTRAVPRAAIIDVVTSSADVAAAASLSALLRQ
jgi:putative RNA 2'-phosphotransferase